MAGTGLAANGQTAYHEAAATATGETVEPGWKLMGTFLGR